MTSGRDGVRRILSRLYSALNLRVGLPLIAADGDVVSWHTFLCCPARDPTRVRRKATPGWSLALLSSARCLAEEKLGLVVALQPISTIGSRGTGWERHPAAAMASADSLAAAGVSSDYVRRSHSADQRRARGRGSCAPQRDGASRPPYASSLDFTSGAPPCPRPAKESSPAASISIREIDPRCARSSCSPKRSGAAARTTSADFCRSSCRIREGQHASIFGGPFSIDLAGRRGGGAFCTQRCRSAHQLQSIEDASRFTGASRVTLDIDNVVRLGRGSCSPRPNGFPWRNPQDRLFQRSFSPLHRRQSAAAEWSMPSSPSSMRSSTPQRSNTPQRSSSPLPAHANRSCGPKRAPPPLKMPADSGRDLWSSASEKLDASPPSASLSPTASTVASSRLSYSPVRSHRSQARAAGCMRTSPPPAPIPLGRRNTCY